MYDLLKQLKVVLFHQNYFAPDGSRAVDAAAEKMENSVF